MLAQVLWKQIVYRHQHNVKVKHGVIPQDDKVEHGVIPQGTIVFLASTNGKAATVIYEEMVLVVSRSALIALESEQDIIPIKELQKKYHNNRNSPCLLK